MKYMQFLQPRNYIRIQTPVRRKTGNTDITYFCKRSTVSLISNLHPKPLQSGVLLNLHNISNSKTDLQQRNSWFVMEALPQQKLERNVTSNG